MRFLCCGGLVPLVGAFGFCLCRGLWLEWFVCCGLYCVPDVWGLLRWGVCVCHDRFLRAIVLGISVLEFV